MTLHRSYTSTTLQAELQLHYATLHPAVVGEVTDQCDYCNHCNHSKKTQLQPPFNPPVDSLPSVIHNNQPVP